MTEPHRTRRGAGRRAGRRALAVSAVAGGALLLPTIVGAEESDGIEVGWWRRAVVSALPLVSADVPDGGILVGADPDGPHAIAALRIASEGGVPAQVTLRVSDAVGIPTGLVACVAAPGWPATEDGALEDAPGADCEAGSVAVSADASEWSIPLDGLGEDELSIVLLPTESITPWRVSFEAPVETDIVRVAPSRPQPSPATTASLPLATSPGSTVGSQPRIPSAEAEAALTAGIGPPPRTPAPTPASLSVPTPARPSTHGGVGDPSPLIVGVAAAIGAVYVLSARRTAAWTGSHPLRTMPALATGGLDVSTLLDDAER